MKRFRTIGLFLFTAIAFTACKNTEFKTLPSGLKYMIIPGEGKDSAAVGNVLKLNMKVRLSGNKDTVLADTYGKLPFYTAVRALPPGQSLYDPSELFPRLKKGDSLVVLIYVDSAIQKGMLPEAQLPPYLKKGDKLTYTYKVLEIFKSDSIARADYQKEMIKDAPRQQKEQEAMMMKMKDEKEAAQKAEDAALEQSGEKAKQTAFVEGILKQKGINASKTPLGAFIKLDSPGTGAQVADAKYVTVKYTGKKMLNDSTFEGPSSFTTKVGIGGIIRGLEDGLKQFRQGGKGTVYIPGYLAYGKTPPPGAPFKEYEPLSFEVEIAAVSDSMPAPQLPPVAPPAEKEKK
ncbi:FKBP-type peptidyl-prolyl cis-trans isomerase [Niabella sp. CC-SYL272]|uniref:FKBP-type peptidyl-prolyl cis-trans isomerase n=1 Tax=Niabella agricola TaxID=2891571 RepID=UPI001F47B86A|nr:FKBP-type peptidyl-prolyl cis-trans isomerase [Niabella agricola]MCF3108393.1 FKBP-type peptidyl-prolyl cis-trans isomerase [Niabella agricola]